MSGSAKPPRSFEEIAKILVDAETFSVTYAARRHRCHRNTVRNLRIDWGDDPRVVQICARIRKRSERGWIREARAARQQLLERVLHLAERGKNLRSAVEALRRVGELVMASEIVDPESPGAQPREPDQPPPPRGAEGPGGG